MRARAWLSQLGHVTVVSLVQAQDEKCAYTLIGRPRAASKTAGGRVGVCVSVGLLSVAQAKQYVNAHMYAIHIFI